MEPNQSTDTRAAEFRGWRQAIAMIADVVGYSRRLEQDQERNLERVVRSFELFRSLIGDYGGEVANVSGDGILALFETPEQALRFAGQVQTEFRDQAVWSEGDPILFRIGISSGEVKMNLGLYQGHCVNLAARLQVVAEPGGTTVTAEIMEAVRDLPGFTFKSMGRPAMKNLARSVEVFAVERTSKKPARPIDIERAPPLIEPAGHPSVAVLALENLSGDRGNDHLALGIVEDVIANLSRFRNLMVIARHSAFLFEMKTHSAREIGHRLGARYLLSGSLRRSAERLRIAVDLIDTGAEDTIWSDRFDIEIDELFDVQDQITGEVAARLSAQIDLAQLKRESRHPHDMRAYGLVLRGQQLLLQDYSKAANAHARRLFEEAIEIAPDYGRAYSAMSRTHNHDWRYEWSPDPAASLDRAIDFARQAIRRDALDARGHSELGLANLYKKRHEEALAEYARALALNPNDAEVIAEYADALVYAEQPEKSLELLAKAMRLNPYFPDWYLWFMADAYNALGRSADVIATVQRMQNPAEGSRLLAANFAHLGMMNEARAAAGEVMRLHPEFSIGAWRHRPPYRDEAILERYIEGMRKAGLPE